MCGIVGYIGTQEATSILLTGLKELEYRGYDSAGIALQDIQGLRCFKAVGKLANLVAKVGDFRTQGAVTAIGHTRWATHGKPTEANAHPHGVLHSRVVHNGIIENHAALRAALSAKFLSQTDTEVIVHLFDKHLTRLTDGQDAALAAFRATLDELHGAYAILLITENCPGQIFFARKGSPLQIGFTADGCHFASSDAPMVGLCAEAIYLEDGQWGVATADSLSLVDASGALVTPRASALPSSRQAAQKEGHRFFMEKEIYEQPRVLADILTGRIRDGAVTLDELPADWLGKFRSVTLCACGTSYHAALTGSYLLERLARVSSRVEIASEFRYRDPVLDPDSLFVVISQSGETADTLEALKLAKAQGLATLALCNVENSTIIRTADHSILLRAGIEKGVASTKAFSAQVMTLWLLALSWGSGRGVLDTGRQANEIAALRASADVMNLQPGVHERIHGIHSQLH